jgi:tetratricopeptide (TPR) repeat protein
VWIGLSRCRAGQGRVSEALAAAERALGSGLDSPRAHLHLGLALEAAGAHGRAEEALLRALELAPSSRSVHHALAEHYERRAGDEARARYHRALAERGARRDRTQSARTDRPSR